MPLVWLILIASTLFSIWNQIATLGAQKTKKPAFPKKNEKNGLGFYFLF